MTFKIFYKNGCPYCEKVENTLNAYELKYKKYVLDEDFTIKWILKKYFLIQQIPHFF